MKSYVTLRIAAVFSLLFALGHTLGARRSWSPQGENEVLRAMRSVHFDVAGVSRSFLDFYRGFGFLLSVFLLLQAVVLWLLAGTIRTQPNVARPLVAAFAVANAANALLSWQFLFPVPAIFAGVLAVVLALALLRRPAR